MTTILDANLGRINVPAATVSYPGNHVAVKGAAIVTAALYRAKAAERGYFKDLPQIGNPEVGPTGDWYKLRKSLEGEVDPELLWGHDLVWASVNHNERTNIGAAGQFVRVLNTTGTGFTLATNSTGFNVIALSSTSIAAATGHLSIMTTTANSQASEFTGTGLGSSPRLTGAVSAGYVAPASLNAVGTSTVIQTYTATGAATVFGAALFDSQTVSGSNIYAEVNFTEGNALLANTDVLVVTWTVTM